jgi:hypothetical protein
MEATHPLDFAAVIQSPTRDPDWLRKCAIMGLFALIPLAGFINLLGWEKEIYRQRRQNPSNLTLPEPSFNYLASGFELFLAAWLPLVAFSLAVGVLAGILMALKLGLLAGLLRMVGGLVQLALSLVLTPALALRHLERGTNHLAVLDVPGTMRVITSNTAAFGLLVGTSFVASLIGGVGCCVCIGIIVTLPFSAAIRAQAAVEFAQVNSDNI